MKEDLGFLSSQNCLHPSPPPSIASTEETEKRTSKREERVVGVEGMEPNPMAIKICFVFLSTICSMFFFVPHSMPTIFLVTNSIYFAGKQAEIIPVHLSYRTKIYCVLSFLKKSLTYGGPRN
jgi:hypothetical protein